MLRDLFPIMPGATRVVGEKWQYVFVLLIAARCCLAQPEKSRPRDGRETIYCSALCWLSLLVLSWVCSLYRVFFQPVPCIFAVALAVAFVEGWTLFCGGTARI